MNLDFLDSLDGINVNYKDIVIKAFGEYDTNQKTGEIYKQDHLIPETLIKLYYCNVDDPIMDDLMSNFKKRYIVNECQLENVHQLEEQEGLGDVYDYIHKYLKESDINVYIILKLHQLLFSKVNNPECGGGFRKMDAHLSGTRLDLSSWDNIPGDISKLFSKVQELVKIGIHLGKSKDDLIIIDYINECVDLNCELIRIHPFFDGNGRTVRAFTNLLFKLAKIPPIYVKLKEKQAYHNAMHKAIADNEKTDIHQFYYYKICDSIVELDMSVRKNKQDKTLSLHI